MGTTTEPSWALGNGWRANGPFTTWEAWEATAEVTRRNGVEGVYTVKIIEDEGRELKRAELEGCTDAEARAIARLMVEPYDREPTR